MATPLSPTSPNNSAPTSHGISGEQRSRLWKVLGDSTFGVVAQMYIADFVPRVRAGLEALGVGDDYLGWVAGPVAWDHTTDPSDIVFNELSADGGPAA